MGDVIELDEFRGGGWIVAKCVCRLCGADCVSGMPAEAPRDSLECLRCGEMTMSVTHYERDGELIPRMEAV
jgi:hypothetical protein